jgi:uncharacterized surface anchored protein
MYKTDKTGIVYVPSLEPGWYTVAETKAADGYIPDASPRNVEITYGDAATLEIENTPVSGLVIVKTDASTGSPLKGVKFEVAKSNGEQVGVFATDKSGRIVVDGIPSGKYVVMETKTLKGYVLDSTAYEVTVHSGKQIKLEVENEPLAGLRILKIDSVTKKPISGVEFMVFDSNSNVVGTYITDNNGIIDFAGILPEGRYTIRETRAANGYYCDDMPRTVEFKSGKVTEIVWENTPLWVRFRLRKSPATPTKSTACQRALCLRMLSLRSTSINPATLLTAL